MKVVNNNKQDLPPVTLEFTGPERVRLARILNTLAWSSLPGYFDDDFIDDLFAALSGPLDPDDEAFVPIETARLNND